MGYGQRIAYVGTTRLIISIMLGEAAVMPALKRSRRKIHLAADRMGQKMTFRLYAHINISVGV